MKRIIDYLKQSFSISRGEAIGTLLLFGVIFTVWAAAYFADKYFSKTATNISIVTTERLDSLNKEKKNYYSKDYEKRSSYKSYPKGEKTSVKAETFSFDPNVTTTSDFKRLGIPSWVANNIDKYRNKGGVFKYKEDLIKMYGFPLETYERLEASIQLPSKENLSVETPQSEYSGSFEKNKEEYETKESTPTEPFVARKKKVIQPFDLNKADTAQLTQIRGIGKVTAERIVKFRDNLGGFHNAEQVRDTYNLPPETADELLKYASVKSAVKKVNINTIQLKEFRHPVLKYNQRKALVNYREQHGLYKTLDDLKKIRIIDEAAINKFAPYVEF
jgi:DNA uptake protein ComE-like DNA-binding protein